MADVISAVRDAFGNVARPQRFTVGSPRSADDEVERANAMFASRNPESLLAADVGIRAGWPEVFLTDSARHYYMPAFVRLIIERDNDANFTLDDFLNLLSPDVVSALDPKQKTAIASALELIRDREDQRGQELIDRRLKRLRA